jgi:hypothetical protein
MNRRGLLASSALVLPAVAACSLLPTNTVPTVKQFIATVSAWMPFVSAGILTAAAFVPAMLPFEAIIQGGLSAVQAILANISETMTAAQAMPLAKQIIVSVQATMANVHTAVAVIPPGATANKMAAIVAQADAAAMALQTLVLNMSAAVPVSAPMAPAQMGALYVRSIR